MVQIKLPDGSIKEFPEAVSPRDVALSISKRLADVAVAAVARGHVVDLDRPLENGDGSRSTCGSSRRRTASRSTSCAIPRRTSWPGPSCGFIRA